MMKKGNVFVCVEGGKDRERWLFNLCGERRRVAVIDGFVSQLIKKRKFQKK